MRKEKIYTIPVTDAFSEDCECPICFLHDKLENSYIDYVLGPANMEVDFRKETNELGFCQKHYEKLYGGKNILGLTLVVHTHMLKLYEDIEKLSNPHPKFKKKLFSGGKVQKSKLSKYIDNNLASCYICNRINKNFDLYIDTLFYLWKNESSFQELVKNSKGFCLNHYALLYDTAPIKLKAKAQKDFLETITSIQLANYQRILSDIEWFIRKYDYRFADQPWKNSKDATKRAIQKLSSLNME
jgi:hypothetical protein